MNAHVTARAGKVPRGGRGRFPFNVQTFNIQISIPGSVVTCTGRNLFRIRFGQSILDTSYMQANCQDTRYSIGNSVIRNLAIRRRSDILRASNEAPLSRTQPTTGGYRR